MEFTKDYTMTINGQAAPSQATFPVLNPANEQEIGQAPDCSKAQLDEAVAAARSAFPSWRATPIEERQKLVVQLAGVLAANIEPLKRLLTSEQGKTHEAAVADIMGAAYWLQSVSGMTPPVIVNEDTPERRSETRHVPIGVVGAIAPWNFPIMLGMWKVGPALVAGNTLVLKPSPFTPLTTLKVAELARDIFPPGVFNVVTGGDDLGPWMTSHPGIDKISFTGSSQTGRKVMESASPSLKRITLELGGNDAAIVMPDVDVEKVAEQIFWSAFSNSGQICVAAKRIYIHQDIYDPMVNALVAYARTVKIGDGAEQGTQLGPIQNKLQYQRVLDLIADAKAKGYKFLLGGETSEAPGYFVPITLLDNPPDDARIVAEEQFGPVLPLMKFTSTEEVVSRANASPYGLAGSVWSADSDAALKVAEQLETGTVWVNESLHLTPFAAFGGHKQSGLGQENGMDGLLEYTNVQTITVKKQPVAAA